MATLQSAGGVPGQQGGPIVDTLQSAGEERSVGESQSSRMMPAHLDLEGREGRERNHVDYMYLVDQVGRVSFLVSHWIGIGYLLQQSRSLGEPYPLTICYTRNAQQIACG